MNRNIILMLATSTLLLGASPLYAQEREVKFSKQIKNIEAEFQKGQFTNVETYGNIITLCNATPKSGLEFDSWKVIHVDDEALDIKSMEQQVKQCDKIKKKGYRDLENLYKLAQNSGEKVAPLLLARLIPYSSSDKVELLLSAASWSQESVDLLGKVMLDNELDSPPAHRKFWLSVSNMSEFYPDKYLRADNQLLSLIEGVDMLTIEELINQWQDATVDERHSIINVLKEL